MPSYLFEKLDWKFWTIFREIVTKSIYEFIELAN